MKAEFEIKVTTGAMYQFLMYHVYHGFSGIFSIIAGVAVLVLYFMTQGENSQSWIYLLFGVLFLAYEPWTQYNRAVKQTKLNPVFKKPLSYCADENGITVTQGETVNEVAWENVTKVRETGMSILVYTGKRNAFIWVKKQLGGEENAVRELLKTHVAENKRKMK